MKHSPDPWRVEELSAGGNTAFAVCDATGRKIASITRTEGTKTSEIDRIHAAMVRAAPTMTKALAAVQRQSERNKPIRGHEMDMVREALRLVPGALTGVLDSIHPRPDWEHE